MLAVDVSLQAATSTFAHCLPEDFSLDVMDQSRHMSAISTTSTSDLDFEPRPLPYPSVRRQTSLNSMASSQDEGSSNRGSLVDFEPFNSPRSTSLRDLLRRQSLGSSRGSSLSSRSRRPTNSYGSITTCSSRRGGGHGDGESFAKRPDILSSAYASLLPSATHSPFPDHIPTLNRAEWHEDVGLSPRSSPAIMGEYSGMMGPILEMPDLDSDSDIAPLRLDAPEDPSLARRTYSETERMVPKLLTFDAPKSHRRSDSNGSLGSTLDFPLPPARSVGVDSVSNVEADECSSALAPSAPIVSEICLDTPLVDSLATVEKGPTVPGSPDSPTLMEIIEENRRKLGWDEEEDLSLSRSSSLIEVAASNGIISPNSNLLRRSRGSSASVQSTTPRTARLSDVSDPREEGWSGSESEEEGFAEAIRSITLRKLAGGHARLNSNLSIQTTSSMSTICLPHFVVETAAGDHSSLVSTASSMTSSIDSSGPVTPNVDAMSDCELPLGKLVGASKQLHHISSSTSVASSQHLAPLPNPTRKVDGWGRPEILLDEDWGAEESELPWSNMGGSSDEEGDSIWAASRSSTPKGLENGVVGLGIDCGSLLDEAPPSI